MTQQQIIDAGIDYTMQNYPVCIAGDALADMARQMNRNTSFEAGAKWAKEELIKDACEWLKNKVADEVLFKCGSVIMVLTVDELIKEFSKALDE